ncbi:MAG: group II truncated hemoglobin [Betaproteobacteria bacterium]|nr:group II truncated hemoglobin [Betaproteobacteria bacterium]
MCSRPDQDTREDCPIADSEKARALELELGALPASNPVRVAAPSVASQPAVNGGSTVRHNPHFGRIGDEAAIERLVERFYHYMDSLPEAATVRAMHPADLAPVKAVLVRFLIEWTGGPQRYSEVRGQPRLRRKHVPFAIGVAERDAWMACMTRALADTVADVELRDELGRAFFKTANFLRNDEGNLHDHHR